VIQHGLTLADFNSFDSTFDNLLLLQIQKKTIADFKEAQSALIAERAKSIQNAKLASLGEMSAGIAHEINNPLSIIQASASLLLKHINNPVKLTEKIESINKSCMRISKIISGLMKFSRSGKSVQYGMASISAIANEALLLTSTYAKQNLIQVKVEINSSSTILCNEVEIEQVFINLINNAVDAVKDLPDKWVKISVFDEGENAVVQILDSGKGIPEKVREKIFQPFFTTKEVGKGTGLGLSIALGILGEHKATISIISENPNTCFEIRFKKSQ
jgi:C4-dicarboxylate-specific signal transduction histidine kinase